MRTPLALLAIGLLVLVPSPLLLADEEPAANTLEAKIRDLLEDPRLREDLLGGVRRRLQRMRSLAPGVSEKFEELFDADALLEILVPICAKHLDEEAVDALLAFKRSAEARRADDAMKRILEESAPAVEAWARSLLDRASEEARREQAEISTPDAGVQLGEGCLDRDWLAQWEGFGVVADIRYGDLDPRAGIEIAMVGSRGALVADDETREVVVSQVEFAPSLRFPAAVDADGDGRLEYYERRGGLDLLRMAERSRAERSWSALDLRDAAGHTRWSYGGEELALSMAAGNLDDDAFAEFVVGFAGEGGLHLVDHEGRRVWEAPAREVWQVEVADLDGDGAQDIVHADGEGRVTIRDASGRLVRRLTLPEPIDGFSLCPWPDAGGRTHLLVWSPRQGVRVLDAHGKPVHAFALPDDLPVQGAWATPVVLDPKLPPARALIVHYPSADPARAMLHAGTVGALLVFLADGTLTYHEVLDSMGSGLGVLPEGDSGAEVLLVASAADVLTYARGEAYGTPAPVEPREVPSSEPPSESPPEVEPPRFNDAVRAMTEVESALAGTPVSIRRLVITPLGAVVCITAADFLTGRRYLERLDRNEYLRARVPVIHPVADVDTWAPLGSHIEMDFRFRLEDEADDPAPEPSPQIDRAFLAAAAVRAGLREVYASRVREHVDKERHVVMIGQHFEYESSDGSPAGLTLARLRAFLAEIATEGHYRVREIRWVKHPQAGEDGVPGDAIPRARIAVWTWTSA